LAGATDEGAASLVSELGDELLALGLKVFEGVMRIGLRLAGVVILMPSLPHSLISGFICPFKTIGICRRPCIALPPKAC
jgi:hypothetical protein